MNDNRRGIISCRSSREHSRVQILKRSSEGKGGNKKDSNAILMPVSKRIRLRHGI